MKKIISLLIVISIISLCVFAFVIFSYNKSWEEDEEQHKKDVEMIKEEQEKLDSEFNLQQQAHEQEIAEAQQEYEERLKEDWDGDGLTYEEELAIGTSDENIDSDGDSVPDNQDMHPAGGGEIYRFTIPWTHNNQPFTTQFGIAEDWYWYYRGQERSTAADSRFATPDDPVIQTISNDIVDASLSTGDTCRYCLAINFVQSMIYQYDIDYNANEEYPKYAIETIVDGRGDCEDTSFLMASIFESLGIDTILLLYSDHMAIGFESDTCPGDYYLYNGKHYCFLETTGNPDEWGSIFTVWGKYVDEVPYVLEVD